MRCEHYPPCESPLAELAHGVIEWSAGVFAGHGASSHEYRLIKVLGFRPMSKVKSSHERDFVLCVQRLGRKILEFMKVQYVWWI